MNQVERSRYYGRIPTGWWRVPLSLREKAIVDPASMSATEVAQWRAETKRLNLDSAPKSRVEAYLEFACHSKACAPPPAGAGGSLPGPSGVASHGPDPKQLGRPHTVRVTGKQAGELSHHVYDEKGNYRGMSSREMADRYVKQRQAQIKATATKRAKKAAGDESHVDSGAGKAHNSGMTKFRDGSTGLKTKKTFPVITAAEARGDSRPVSAAEFQRLANIGQKQLDGFKARASAPKGLDDNWDAIKANSHKAALESWGGDTIDAHTGKSLAKDADVYVVTVKDVGMQSVSVREGATRQEFDAAMDTARSRFGSILSRESHSLGVFHDDDLKRIDIDPVLVVKNRADVDTIGAATHAVGGAFRPLDGNGYWPPHVIGG